jgi:hypothetical protein
MNVSANASLLLIRCMATFCGLLLGGQAVFACAACMLSTRTSRADRVRGTVACEEVMMALCLMALCLMTQPSCCISKTELDAAVVGSERQKRLACGEVTGLYPTLSGLDVGRGPCFGARQGWRSTKILTEMGR